VAAALDRRRPDAASRSRCRGVARPARQCARPLSRTARSRVRQHHSHLGPGAYLGERGTLGERDDLPAPLGDARRRRRMAGLRRVASAGAAADRRHHAGCVPAEERPHPQPAPPGRHPGSALHRGGRHGSRRTRPKAVAGGIRLARRDQRRQPILLARSSSAPAPGQRNCCGRSASNCRSKPSAAIT
jgi:hypothetical protein